jgi:hypothetical protein
LGKQDPEKQKLGKQKAEISKRRQKLGKQKAEISKTK